MTTTVQAGPGTAANLLFGPGANAAEALAQQILSAPTGLDQALERLPEATRHAAVREAAAAAAGLLDVDLDGLLLAGWRAHRDLTGAARRTLAVPGSTELVDLIRHQVSVAQEPSVAVLVDGRQVATIQLGLSVDFDISALVAGIKAGLLVAVHAGTCDLTATLAIQGTDVLTATSHFDLPGVIRVSPGIPLLPAGDYPAAGPARPAVLLGADVVVVFLDDVHGRLLCGRAAAVDADVARDQVLLLIRMGALVLGHQPGPGVGAVVQEQAVHVLVPRLVVVLDVLEVLVLVVILVEVEDGVGFFFGQQLIQGLALGLLVGGVAEPDPGRPPLRRYDATVQGIVPRRAAQRVGRVLDLEVLQVLGLMAGLVRHGSAPFRQADQTNLSRSGRTRRFRRYRWLFPGTQAVASWPPSTTRTWPVM